MCRRLTTDGDTRPFGLKGPQKGPMLYFPFTGQSEDLWIWSGGKRQ